MTRSPLTLAATVSAALPGAAAISAAPLSAGESGRYDSAAVGLADGRRVVVRVPVDPSAASDLAAEALALRALTSGARALLPFRAPELLGEAILGEARALVTDLLPGYRVEAADLPGGPGAAQSIGISLAALHALPASVVRAEGLPVRTPEQVRDAVRTLIERTADTRRLPAALATRWRRAVDDDDLWRFESCVVLGEASALSFVFEDRRDVPTVVGVLGWQAFSVGDPAVDLHWIAGAAEAADDIYAAYAEAADRSPDANLRTRARLYAELEFAKWLLHGHEQHRADIVDDAVGLLDALVEGLGSSASRLAPAAVGGVDDAIAVLADAAPRTAAQEHEASIAMQTDAYDPEMVSLFEASMRERGETAPTPVTRAEGLGAPARIEAVGDAADETAPIEPISLSSWTGTRQPGTEAPPEAAPADASTPDAAPETDEAVEAARASRAAFQRWARSASE